MNCLPQFSPWWAALIVLAYITWMRMTTELPFFPHVLGFASLLAGWFAWLLW